MVWVVWSGCWPLRVANSSQVISTRKTTVSTMMYQLQKLLIFFTPGIFLLARLLVFIVVGVGELGCLVYVLLLVGAVSSYHDADKGPHREDGGYAAESVDVHVCLPAV